MTHEDAVELIRPAVEPGQAWAELGAGEGTFTRALGALVGAAGSVHAFDRDPAAVRTLRELTLPGGAPLHVARSDFTRSLDFPPVDGVLMANALHFAREPEAVLRRLAARLPPRGKLLLVEYDRTRGNRWVPYPVPLARLREMAARVGSRAARGDRASAVALPGADVRGGVAEAASPRRRGGRLALASHLGDAPRKRKGRTRRCRGRPDTRAPRPR